MSIQKINKQPSFTSEAILTRSLKRTLNRQKGNQNRQIIVGLVETINHESSNRIYKLGYRYRNQNLVIDVPFTMDKKLYIQISETIEYLGKKLKVKFKHQTPVGVSDLSHTGNTSLDAEFIKTRSGFETEKRALKDKIDAKIKLQNEKQAAQESRQAISNIGKKQKMEIPNDRPEPKKRPIIEVDV